MFDQIFATVDKNRNEILELSKVIHACPEPAFSEFQAAQNLKTRLAESGFAVSAQLGGLETAFRADAGIGGSGPKFAFLAEYDALPEIGHGCGHNIIAAAAFGAAIGLVPFINTMDGQVVVIGCPAEEKGGGKITLLNAGAFDDIDFAMMVHPGCVNLVKRGGTALVSLKINYKGKTAHSSTPEKGINALNAVIQTFNGINAISMEFPVKANTSGIITEGGTVSNVIPDYAACEFLIRAENMRDVKTIVDKVKTVIKSVELMTKAKAEYRLGMPYAERYSNDTMDDIFKKHLTSLGETVEEPSPNLKVGSSDIGNVTLKIPAIHPYIKIADNVPSHTREFTAAAISETAGRMLIKGAKAMAATAYEILSDPSAQQKIKEEFSNKVPNYDDFKL